MEWIFNIALINRRHTQKYADGLDAAFSWKQLLETILNCKPTAPPSRLHLYAVLNAPARLSLKVHFDAIVIP